MSPHTTASPTLNDWNEMSPPAAKAELLTVLSSGDKEGGGENKNGTVARPCMSCNMGALP